MKKRLPLIISFVLFIALCGSATYWFMHLFKNPQARPLTAPPMAQSAEVPLENAARLFGGQLVQATTSNYQLKGVIAGRDGTYGAAIVVADGRPARAMAVGGEVIPGVSLKEVHAQYVMLSENGALKRVNLPEAKGNQLEAITPVQPDNASRMTGPALPVPQPPQPNAPMEPPQSPQQFQPPPNPQQGQGIVPPNQAPNLGPNGEPLNPQHNK
ncbi:MAG: hypothetical protein RL748_1876 [Pseudomonadota bacterium]|jgi:general secretion pathway protein C